MLGFLRCFVRSLFGGFLNGLDLLGQRFGFLGDLFKLFLDLGLFLDQLVELLGELLFLLFELSQLLVGRVRVIRDDANLIVLCLSRLTFAVADFGAVLHHVAVLQSFVGEVKHHERCVTACHRRIGFDRATDEAAFAALNRQSQFAESKVIERCDHDRHFDRFAEDEVEAGPLDHDLWRMIRDRRDACFLHRRIGRTDFVLQFDAIPAVAVDRKRAGPTTSIMQRREVF